MQAQDARGARLAIRARTQGLSVVDVDSAFNEGSMIITWLNRGTLHLILSEDYGWLHALTAPRQINFNLKRLEQEGVSSVQAEKAKSVICDEIADAGPRTRAELRAVLERSDVPTAGQAFIHLLMYCSLRGLIVRGPMDGKEQRFVLVDEWIGKRSAVDPEVALAMLARRYLAGHGPATARDLANWSGMTLGQARAGLKTIASEVEVSSGGQVKLKRSTSSGELPPPRLLGPFDPVLHGWKSREFLIPNERERSVVTTNGLFRPAILVKGQVAGIWRMAGGEVELEPFRKFTAGVRKALDAEVDDIKRFVNPHPQG